MKSKRKTDHLERTASVLRREVCILQAWWGSQGNYIFLLWNFLRREMITHLKAVAELYEGFPLNLAWLGCLVREHSRD